MPYYLLRLAPSRVIIPRRDANAPNIDYRQKGNCVIKSIFMESIQRARGWTTVTTSAELSFFSLFYGLITNLSLRWDENGFRRKWCSLTGMRRGMGLLSELNSLDAWCFNRVVHGLLWLKKDEKKTFNRVTTRRRRRRGPLVTVHSQFCNEGLSWTIDHRCFWQVFMMWSIWLEKKPKRIHGGCV